MPKDHHIDNADRAMLCAWLMEAKLAVLVAIEQTQGDQMNQHDMNRCFAAMEQARAKLAYAWNVLSPYAD